MQTVVGKYDTIILLLLHRAFDIFEDRKFLYTRQNLYKMYSKQALQ